MRQQRRSLLWVLTAFVTVVVTLGLAEFLIWCVSPTEYLSPRYQFSAGYGLIPFANTRMVHGVPRKYKFHYTVNSMHSRGNLVRAGASGLPAVVVLGDSYAFGFGVNDGEEFSAVMGRALAGIADVANFSSPAWGLTQEIRRYHEVGAAYNPRIVVLEFCGNDPDDNLLNRVTRFENGSFVFVDSENSLNVIKKFLGRSFLQRTQLYSFLRARTSTIAAEMLVRRETSRFDATTPGGAEAGIPPAERAYIELLEPFAKQLRAEGRTLWLISVGRHLELFPNINASARALEARGDLRYLEVSDWLRGHEPYASREGHAWGAEAHRIIGENLAAEARAALSDSAARP